MSFEFYTMDDGLTTDRGLTSQNCILQDSEGFIWVGSFYGLNRLDGQSVKIFRFDVNDEKSLGNNLISTLCEADDGRIWAGSGDDDLYIFDPRTETFEVIRHDPDDSNSLCGKGINFLAKDQEGNIWVGTRFNGVCRWSKQTGRFEGFGDQIPEGKVFFQQANGTIWIGSSRGLYRLLDGEDRLVRIEHQPGCSGGDIDRVHDICELPDGSLLITSASNGFWQLDPATDLYWNFAGYKSESTTAPNYFLRDSEDHIWMTGNGEVQRYDPFSKQFSIFRHQEDMPTSSTSFSVMFPYQDRAGSLWFMTTGGGVQVAHAIQNPFEVVSDRAGYIFMPLPGNLLLSAFAGIEVIDILTREKVDIGLPPEIARMNPNELVLAGRELWISEWSPTARKMITFNLDTKQVRNLPFLPAPGGLAVDRSGAVWNGLNTYDEGTGSWVSRLAEIEVAIPNFVRGKVQLNDLYFDDENRMWMATNQGVFSYNLQTRESKNYRYRPQVKGSLSSDNVAVIFPGSAGRFYLFTVNGLNVYDPQIDGFLTFDPNNGLLDMQVSTVVEDEQGNPWVGTPRGLQKLDLTIGTFTNYGVADGLTQKRLEIQYAGRDSLGYLYLSQGWNVIRFHPDNLQKNQYVAQVYLMDLYVAHERVRPGVDKGSLLTEELRFSDHLKLAHSQSDFGFGFTMPTFIQADNVEYFYQLWPYDKEWKSAGNNHEVHYTSIGPGRYTFRVKARTAAGVWSPNEATVVIRIVPPWWRTWWAYVLYMVIAGGLLFGIRNYELRRQHSKAEALRLRDLDRVKTRLYTNITHEFRTPLTVIMGITNHLATGAWLSSVDQAERKYIAQSFSLIRRNSKNLLRLINQLLDLSKLDSGTMKVDLVQSDVINYLKYLTESFHPMAEEKGIHLYFISEVEELMMSYDEIKLQHVVYNLLSNAIKFTGEGGQIILRIEYIEKVGSPLLSINVQDTGIGVAKEQLGRIFDRFYQVDRSWTRKGEGTGIGLALTKDLVELMGGDISVSSEGGKGSVFTVLLPVRRDLAIRSEESVSPSMEVLLPDRQPGVRSFSNEEEGSAASVPGDPEKGRLLLIEDNRDVATYIETLLGNKYEIEVAENGKVGIEKALEAIPDIIISDIMMPEKDGYEVCEILKNDERTCHIPIILLTARGLEENKLSGLRAGADAYLMKPFNHEELMIRLEKLVALRQRLQARYSKEYLFPLSGATSPANEIKPTLNDIFLEKLSKAVEARMSDSDFQVSELARTLGMSNVQIFRKLKALTGQSPSSFIRTIRLQKAKELILHSELNISEIAYEVGFSDPNYFSRTFSAEFGFPPSQLRK